MVAGRGVAGAVATALAAGRGARAQPAAGGPAASPGGGAAARTGDAPGTGDASGTGGVPGTGGAAATRPLRLLILGDSITAAYGLNRPEGLPARLEAALRAAGRPVTVIDAGVSGDTTAGGRARLDWALADQPDAVIVALGGNDGLRGLDPRDSQANLAAILEALRQRRVPTLLAGMLAPPNLGAAYGQDFAGSFQALARAHPDIVFYPFLLDGVAGDPALNQPDRIHPNPRGVEEMVRRMLPAVQTLLARVAGGPATG